MSIEKILDQLKTEAGILDNVKDEAKRAMVMPGYIFHVEKKMATELRLNQHSKKLDKILKKHNNSGLLKAAVSKNNYLQHKLDYHNQMIKHYIKKSSFNPNSKPMFDYKHRIEPKFA